MSCLVCALSVRVCVCSQESEEVAGVEGSKEKTNERKGKREMLTLFHYCAGLSVQIIHPLRSFFCFLLLFYTLC